MRVSLPEPVRASYRRIWETGELDAAAGLLLDDFLFRGSLGTEMRGRDAFLGYVRAVRAALDEYRCDILACVTEGEYAFAKMRFSGVHSGQFRGYGPPGQRVSCLGAALFRITGNRIAELWVLGDLASLDSTLKANDTLG